MSDYICRLTTCGVRPFRDSDIAAITRFANNRNVWINLRDAFPHPYLASDAKAFIEMAKATNPTTIFAIDKDNMAIGAIGLKVGRDVERISAEIGYWLAEPYWNQGIMTEVLAYMTDYALKKFEIKRIFAMPFEWNTGSVHVLEKVGYQLEARLRKSAIKDGKIIDQLLYAYVID